MDQLRILVAEDEPLVAYDICESVESAGYAVSGPFSDISSAMLSFQKDRPDCAILDVTLYDGAVYPLAEKLIAENVPVIFHSGNVSSDEVKRRFPHSHALSKPCPPAKIIDSLQNVLAEA